MTELKNIFVSKETTLGMALKVLDENVKYHIVLVVDDNNVLLGTITDGDVRRALLKGASLESEVGSIMNQNPKF